MVRKHSRAVLHAIGCGEKSPVAGVLKCCKLLPNERAVLTAPAFGLNLVDSDLSGPRFAACRAVLTWGRTFSRALNTLETDAAPD